MSKSNPNWIKKRKQCKKVMDRGAISLGKYTLLKTSTLTTKVEAVPFKISEKRVHKAIPDK